jgi:transposase
MKLSDHDLKQIDKNTLVELSLEQITPLTIMFLDDLKEARDRLNQNANNSSRPSGSMAPWESGKEPDQSDQNQPEDDDSIDQEHSDEHETLMPAGTSVINEPTAPATSANDQQEPAQANTGTEAPTAPLKRKAGKQPGAAGFGRTQKLPVTNIVHHVTNHCVICKHYLGEHDVQTAWTGFYSIDIAERTPEQTGILLINTKHVFYEQMCSCGHHNRLEPYVAMPDINWPKTNLSEWRLVGPRLAAMIILLSKRYRNSRKLISEFLLVFLGLELSVGTIDQTIREAGRSVAPLEDELISDIEKAALVYIDETSWKEAGVLRWLWVFRTLTTVFFMVGKRDRTIFCKLILNGKFNGIVMSDGWVVYREYANRLRCWAHLIRKARGLSESCHFQTSKAGFLMLGLLTTFQDAIYDARNRADQPLGVLVIEYQEKIDQLKALCTMHYDSTHEKLRAFARELLKDWDIILRPIHDPSLPLTNNDAEQILRHWVIDRRLSHGTRTQEGTQSFTLLASVIETCRIRGAPVWDYLTQVISAARVGYPLPALPIMQT